MSVREIAFGVAVAAVLGAGCAGDSGTVEDRLPSETTVDLLIGVDNVDSEGPRMCVSGTTVYAVWFDDREGPSEVWLRYSLDGGRSWSSEPVRVNQDGIGRAFNPDIACDGNTVHVVWEDDRDGVLENRNIYYNRSRSAGAEWLQDDVLIDGDVEGLGMSLSPRIVAAGDYVHVAWFDNADGAYDIFVASSDNGGSRWFEPNRLESDGPGASFATNPSLAADEVGHVYVAWEDSRDTLNDIYFAVSNDGGLSWEEDQRLDLGDEPGGADSFSPRLVAEGGEVYVVWHDERGGTRSVLANYSADHGATWLAEPIRLDTGIPLGEEAPADTWEAYNAAIALYEGIAHVAWQDSRNGNGGFDVYHRRLRAGGIDGDETRLDTSTTPGASNSVNPTVAVGPDGLVVSWEDLRHDECGEGDANGEQLCQRIGFNDLYYNYSSDGGVEFNNDDRRIDTYLGGSKFSTNLTTTLLDGHLLNLWVDGRDGSQDVLFQRVPFGEEAQFLTP